MRVELNFHRTQVYPSRSRSSDRTGISPPSERDQMDGASMAANGDGGPDPGSRASTTFEVTLSTGEVVPVDLNEMFNAPTEQESIDQLNDLAGMLQQERNTVHLWVRFVQECWNRARWATALHYADQAIRGEATVLSPLGTVEELTIQTSRRSCLAQRSAAGPSPSPPPQGKLQPRALATSAKDPPVGTADRPPRPPERPSPPRVPPRPERLARLTQPRQEAGHDDERGVLVQG